MRNRELYGKIEGIAFELSNFVDLSFSANEVKIINLRKIKQVDGYVPFDAIRIYNISNSEVIFAPNQNLNFSEPIYPKTEKVITDLNLFSLYFKENDGSAISSGDLKIKVMKQGATPERVVKKMVRWLIWR